MQKILLFLAVGLASISVKAQWQPMSNLTIFSDDGAKFFLILNGERYNDVPETNVRIEELPNPYYDCKIVFEDKAIPVISKNALMLTDPDGIVQDVTYRIKKDKKGKYSLRFYSNIPVQQNMPRPSNCAVYQFGRPHDPIIGSDGHVYETVTVQQTTTTGDNFGMSMNVGGMGVGVSVNVPADEITTTTTTTTTTTSSSSSGGFVNTPRPRPNDGGFNSGCRQPMNARDFADAKNTIAETAFEDTKKSVAEQIVASNCLNTAQIIEIIKLFNFEETKVDFAKTAYDNCIDRNNYYKVVSAFTFDGSKAELNEYLRNRR